MRFKYDLRFKNSTGLISEARDRSEIDRDCGISARGGGQRASQRRWCNVYNGFKRGIVATPSGHPAGEVARQRGTKVERKGRQNPAQRIVCLARGCSHVAERRTRPRRININETKRGVDVILETLVASCSLLLAITATNLRRNSGTSIA